MFRKQSILRSCYRIRHESTRLTLALLGLIIVLRVPIGVSVYYTGKPLAAAAAAAAA